MSMEKENRTLERQYDRGGLLFEVHRVERIEGKTTWKWRVRKPYELAICGHEYDTHAECVNDIDLLCNRLIERV